MTVLQGFPMVSQLTTKTGDHEISENAHLDCVPASLCAGAMYLNRVSQLGGEYTPDSFKDAAEGQGSTGGTAAVDFIDHCASLGIKLFSRRGAAAQLVQMTHEQVRAGHPVIFTEPNPYGGPHPKFTHVCVFFGENAGTLTAMDPFIAQAITKSDAEWAKILSDVDPGNPTKEIWIMEELMIDLDNPTVARYFEPKDAKTWRCKQTGKTIYGENLTFYRTCGYSALRGLDDLGLPLSEEIPIERLDPKFQHLAGKVTVKFYELGVTIFDPENKMGGRPGGGRVYKAHLFDGGPGSETFFRLAQHM